MKRKYIRYVASLALATTFALSPMANAKEINVCGSISISGVSINVEDAVDARDCDNTINSAVTACSGTVVNGVACTSACAVAAQQCKMTVETLNTTIKECEATRLRLERAIREARRAIDGQWRDRQWREWNFSGGGFHGYQLKPPPPKISVGGGGLSW